MNARAPFTLGTGEFDLRATDSTQATLAPALSLCSSGGPANLDRWGRLERLEKVGQGRARAALIGLELCSALVVVHGLGLLHRDIKAKNAMREDGGRNVLMDFGLGDDHAP